MRTASRFTLSRIAPARLRRLAGSAAVLAALAPTAHAQSTALWTNGTASTANWNDPANWFNGIHGFGQTGALVLFNNTDLSGPQTVALDGTYTVGTFSVGDNAGTRHPYTFSGGTLVFDGNGSTAAYNQNQNTGPTYLNSAVQLVDDLTFTIQTGASLTIGGSITGNRTLTKSELGTLILTGAANESTNVTLSRGTLQLGDGGTAGTLGSGTVTMSNSSVLRFNRSDDVTVSNTLAGVGFVEQAGTGTLSLTGTNTFSAGVRLTAGALEVGSSGAIGNFGTLTFNGGTLRFSAANTTDYSARFSNATSQLYRLDTNGQNVTLASALTSSGGTLTKLGSGTLTLSGENTYDSGTTLSAGTLALGSSAALGSSGTITFAGGTLQFSAANTTDYSARFSTAANQAYSIDTNDQYVTLASALTSSGGSLTKLGDGLLALAGDNTYSGPTTISAGILQVGDSGSSGTLGTGDVSIAENAKLVFQRSTTAGPLAVANTISGSGAVELRSSVILTGANTFSGTISLHGAGPTLQVGDGGNSGSLGLGNVQGGVGTTLRFDRAGSLTVPGNLNIASLDNFGSGAVTLTGNNSFGAIRLSNGTLAVGSAGALGSGSTINFAGGTLQFTAANTTDYSARFGTSGQDYRIDTNGQNVTFATALTSQTGALTKLGAGTLTLTGAGTYSIRTTLSGGTLALRGAGLLGPGELDIGDATLDLGDAHQTVGSLRFTGNASVVRATGSLSAAAISASIASGTITINGDFGGTGTLVKSGAGTAILTGNNTYSGGTTLSAGTLALGSAGALGTSGQISFNGGTLQFSAANTTDYSTRFSSAVNQAYRLDTNGQNITLASALTSSVGTLTKLGNGTLTLSGNNTYSGTTTISAGTLQIGNAGTSGSLGSGSVTNNASLIFNQSVAKTIANSIFGSGSFTKLGNGELTLTGTNSYAGNTTISVGTLRIGNGGTSGSLGLGNVVNNTRLLFHRSDDIAVANAISGTGSVTKLGAGTLTLTASNTYTGDTRIDAGTIQIGDGGASGSLGSGAIFVGTNATLAFNRSDDLTMPQEISGYGFLVKKGDGTLTLNGASSIPFSGNITVSSGTLQIGDGGTSGSLGFANVTNNATLAFNRSDSITVANVISGSGSFTKLGADTLILTGANTYSGGTTVSAGTLQIGNGGSSGSLGPGVVTNNASLAFNRSDSITAANAISGSGSLYKLGAGTLTLTGANTYSGSTTITAGTLTVGDGGTTGTLGSGAVSVATGTTLAFNRSDTLTVANDISGSGSIVHLGTGSLALSGNNTFTGGATISSGTWIVGSNTALGTGTVVLNGGTLAATGDARTLANAVRLDADSTFSGSSPLTLTGAFTLARTRELTLTAGSTLTLAGGITQTGGGRSFTKLGDGTLNLAAASTYTGGTYLGAGTTRINNLSGSAFGTGAVTVESGATLTGAGSFTGALQLNGTYSPGNSPGLSSTGSQTWAGGASYLWEINDATGAAGTAFDQLSITGSLSITATSASPFTVRVVSLLPDNSPGLLANFDPARNHSYSIASTTAGISGFDPGSFIIDGSAFANAFAGGSWSLGLGNSGRDLVLSFTSAIPEPASAAALLGLATLGLVASRRRRRA